MKIGIFTDAYRPSVNGVVYVTEILRRNFEALGHEVYIFAPAPNLNGVKSDDPHIIRFPALSGVYEEGNFSLIFPPTVLKNIKELNLDIIHFLTPGPTGLMAIYAAHKLGVPLVAEYCTDVFEYAQHYALALPGVVALGAVVPFTFKVSAEEIRELIKASRPRLRVSQWNKHMIKHLLTVIHEHCDAVIVHSRKSATQLKSWQDEDDHYPVNLIPTGVDPLPSPLPADLEAFKHKHGIGAHDEVVTYIGRLSAEKNLDILIDMAAELIKWRPHAKLLYVGDFDYRPVLEEKAARSPAANHIIFAGKLPREDLGLAHACSSVFVFPSLTDTQGLALHEAALAGLPIVMVDREVSEVLHDGKNGFYAENDPIDMAAKVRTILEDPNLAKSMSAASRKIAAVFAEQAQAKKILALYQSVIQARRNHAQ